jgi:hypothetical protein
VSFVCCQVESPTECGASERDREAFENDEASAHDRLSSHKKRKKTEENHLCPLYHQMSPKLEASVRC